VQDSYVTYASSSLFLYVGGQKTVTFESDGGILHGSWNAESPLITSDRRMKREIVPLQRTLRAVVQPRDDGLEAKAGTTAAAASALRRSIPQEALANKPIATGDSPDGALWLLRQLRPVSYSFKKGAESKFMRFGFIADELESVVPQVVRTMGTRDVADQKAVVYQDLIALLAAAAQSQQAAIEQQQAAIEQQQQEFVELKRRLEELEKMERKKKLRRRPSARRMRRL
jgi:hypothetical protein